MELDRYSNVSPREDVAPRAQAYGVPYEIVDGNDITVVWETTARAAQRARSGGGPTFLEFKTYRRSTHYTGDPGGYQTEEEIKSWEKKDPVDRCRKLLLQRGILNETKDQELLADIDDQIEESVRFAEQSPFPEPEEADPYA